MKAVHSLVLLAACLPGAACAADASKGEDVRFKTADGLTIAATFYPAAEGTPLPVPVVIALPMYRRTRDTYAPVVGPLTARGMAVLALDLRGHGDSAKQGDENLSQKVESRDPSIFTAMHQDVEGAIAWLAREKHTPKRCIGLLGASVGCSVAIDTAVRDPGDVACVVCLTPGKDYLGVPTMDHIAHWTTGMPLLLVATSSFA